MRAEIRQSVALLHLSWKHACWIIQMFHHSAQVYDCQQNHLEYQFWGLQIHFSEQANLKICNLGGLGRDCPFSVPRLTAATTLLGNLSAPTSGFPCLPPTCHPLGPNVQVPADRNFVRMSSSLPSSFSLNNTFTSGYIINVPS